MGCLGAKHNATTTVAAQSGGEEGATPPSGTAQHRDPAAAAASASPPPGPFPVGGQPPVEDGPPGSTCASLVEPVAPPAAAPLQMPATDGSPIGSNHFGPPGGQSSSGALESQGAPAKLDSSGFTSQGSAGQLAGRPGPGSERAGTCMASSTTTSSIIRCNTTSSGHPAVPGPLATPAPMGSPGRMASPGRPGSQRLSSSGRPGPPNACHLSPRLSNSEKGDQMFGLLPRRIGSGPNLASGLSGAASVAGVTDSRSADSRRMHPARGSGGAPSSPSRETARSVGKRESSSGRGGLMAGLPSNGCLSVPTTDLTTNSLIDILADDLPDDLEEPPPPAGFTAREVSLPAAPAAVGGDDAPAVVVESGVCAEQGTRSLMEDAHTWCPALKLNGGCTSSLALVADGHSGRAVARAACALMPKLLAEELTGRHSSDPALALCCAVGRTDRQLAKQRTRGGSTLCACLVHAGRVWVANLGDCRAVLACGGQSVDLVDAVHRPDCPAEAARVVAAGGEIDDGRVAGCLAVTRALGDWNLKGGELAALRGDTPLVVSNEPAVSVVTLTPDCTLLVVACDGIWDSLSDDEAIGAACEKISSGGSCEDAARAVVKLSLEKGSKDNCTAMVLRLQVSEPRAGSPACVVEPEKRASRTRAPAGASTTTSSAAKTV